jgi:PAS domain S-box-containing protein
MTWGPDHLTYFRRIAEVALVLLILGAAHIPGAEAAPRKIVLQLSWDHQFEFAGFYAALWEGFYRDAGFDVEIRPALKSDGSVISPLQSLLDRQADFAIDGASFMLGAAQGQPIMAVAPIFQTSIGALFFPESVSITGIGDLRGKKIGYPAGDRARLFELDTMLAAEGINPSSMEKTAFAPERLFPALKAGEYDVLWGYGTSIPYLARQAGMPLKSLQPAQFGVNFYGDTLLTRSDTAERDPHMVERFRDASLQGWEYALANTDEMALRIARTLPRAWPNQDLAQFNRQQAAIVTEAMKYPYVRLGNSNPERWQLMMQQLVKAQILSAPLPVEKFLFDPERAERLRAEWIELILGIGLAGIGLVFLTSVGGGFMLRRAVRRRTAELSDARADLEQLTATLEARVRERSRAVLESETRLREITDALPSLVWTAAPNGELTWVNRRWCQFTGLSYDQSIRHGWLRALHPDDHDRRVRSWSLAQECGTFELECRFRRADGAWIWFMVRAMPRRDANGKTREWIGSSTEIHHRKQAERDRALLSEIYPALMEEGSTGDLALLVAEALGRHLGAARVVFLEFELKGDLCAVTGRYMREPGLLPAEFRFSSFGQPLVDELRAGRGVAIDDVTLDRLTAGAARTFLAIRAHALLFKPLLRHGNLVAAVSVIEDQPRQWLASEIALLDEVAERSFLAMDRLKTASALKKAKVAADLANLSKSRFLAAASHDLRQPFQAMRLFHHVLSARLRETEDIHAAAKLGEAMTSGEELLNSLLDISTLDAGTMRMSIDNVAVDDLLEELRSSFAPVAAQKGLTLKVVSSRCRIRTDPVLFKRMVRNLVSNAIRYTSRGGLVLGCRNRGTFLHVQVWDSGIGIPSDQLEAVFDDFYQVHNPERDRTKGLGLGLSIVRRTAHLLGHDISVRSRQGRGSVFTIVVPKAKELAAAMLPALEAPRPAARRHKILLVEDDAAQLAGMRTLLESWGHMVVIAAPTPEVAMMDLRTSAVEPSLIITDFRLPGQMNGEEFIERVQTELGRTIPSVIVTGDTAERLRAAESAGVRVVYKPFRPAELSRVIESLPGPALREQRLRA